MAFRERLGPGAPLEGGVRGRMERAFGRDFSAVRLHDGAEGARAAGSALAAAAGDHVALSAAAPRPGTLGGDALLAHELAHTAQQAHATSWGGGSAAALEDEANAAAAATVLGLPMPRLRPSGLQLRSCNPASESQAESGKLLEMLADPRKNQAALIQSIDDAGTSLPDMLAGHPMFGADSDRLRAWATIPGAHPVLEQLARALERTGNKGLTLSVRVKAVLDERAEPEAERSADQQAELRKINAAIDADRRKADYQDPAQYDPPLTFPVQFFPRWAPVGGQVYYDPGLPRERGRTGETGGGRRFTRRADGEDQWAVELQTYSWIRLGSLALSSDDMIRSALYHEAQHYRIDLEQMKGSAGDPVARDLRGLGESSRVDGKISIRGANEDTEILGIQIAADAAGLSVKENANLLWYLAEQLRTSYVREGFQTGCYYRIAAAAAADPEVKTKLLSALGESVLSDEDKKLLGGLKAKIEAAASKATTSEKTSKGSKTGKKTQKTGKKG